MNQLQEPLDNSSRLKRLNFFVLGVVILASACIVLVFALFTVMGDRDVVEEKLSDVTTRELVASNITTMVRNFSAPYTEETDNVKVFSVGGNDRVVCAFFNHSKEATNPFSTLYHETPDPARSTGYPEEYRDDTQYYTLNQTENNRAHMLTMTSSYLSNSAGKNCYLVLPFEPNEEKSKAILPQDFTEPLDICGLTYYYSEERTFRQFGDEIGEDRIVTGDVGSGVKTSTAFYEDAKIFDVACNELSREDLKENTEIIMYFPQINPDGSGYFTVALQTK